MRTFNEDALNIAFERALGYCAPFSEDDCQLVTSLVVMHACDISELTAFPNLRHLEIFACIKLDLAPFSVLKELEVLKILCTPLPDTQAIGELRSLKEIELNFTSAEDITPILALPNLTKAVFMANPLSEASYKMIEALKIEQVSSPKVKKPMIWVSDQHSWNATRTLFDLGYPLCCGTANEMDVIVKPGRPTFTSLECDYLTEISKWVLLDLLKTEKWPLATIFEELMDPEIDELERSHFSRIDHRKRHFATASEARRWVDRSTLSLKMSRASPRWHLSYRTNAHPSN